MPAINIEDLSEKDKLKMEVEQLRKEVKLERQPVSEGPSAGPGATAGAGGGRAAPGAVPSGGGGAGRAAPRGARRGGAGGPRPGAARGCRGPRRGEASAVLAPTALAQIPLRAAVPGEAEFLCKRHRGVGGAVAGRTPPGEGWKLRCWCPRAELRPAVFDGSTVLSVTLVISFHR